MPMSECSQRQRLRAMSVDSNSICYLRLPIFSRICYVHVTHWPIKYNAAATPTHDHRLRLRRVLRRSSASTSIALPHHYFTFSVTYSLKNQNQLTLSSFVSLSHCASLLLISKSVLHVVLFLFCPMTFLKM